MIIQKIEIKISNTSDIVSLKEYLDNEFSHQLPDSYAIFLMDRLNVWKNTGYELYVVIERRGPYYITTSVSKATTLTEKQLEGICKV